MRSHYGGLPRCLSTEHLVFSYDIASAALWEQEEIPSYRARVFAVRAPRALCRLPGAAAPSSPRPGPLPVLAQAQASGAPKPVTAHRGAEGKEAPWRGGTRLRL